MTKTLTLLAALLLGTAATAHEITLGDLQFIHPNVPLPSASAKAAAGYVAISNAGTETDRLVGISSGIAKSASLHQSSVDASGVARMSPVEALEVPAGDTVNLEPGGYHIMFMGLTGTLTEGAMVPVTLTFEKAGPLAVDFMVDPPGQAGEAHTHGSAAAAD